MKFLAALIFASSFLLCGITIIVLLMLGIVGSSKFIVKRMPTAEREVPMMALYAAAGKRMMRRIFLGWRRISGLLLPVE